LAFVPGEKNVLLRVYNKNEENGTITIGATNAIWPENVGRGGGVIEAKDKKDLVLREALRFEGKLDEILRQMFALEDAPIAFPSRFAASGLLTTDFDFTELTDAYDGRPWSVVHNFHLVTKETEIQSLISPSLAIAGICPRVTDSGKIGFAEFIAPTEREANSVEVDDDVWANIEAARIASMLNATPLINSINVGINKDFQKKDEPGERITAFNIDVLNELGEAKQLNYDSMIKTSWAARGEDIAERINETFTNVHFPIFGRESVVVEIPCNWRAKQIKCGDLVKVTHELIYDTPRGALGVTDALGLVVGRKLAIAQGNDILRIRIFAGNPWKAVAPTALATAYNSTSAYMTVSSKTLYSMSGETDLDDFNKTYDVNVRLYPYNVAGTDSYLATVTSVNTSLNRVYFSSAPLTTAEWTTSGFWITMADWDNRTSSAMSGFAYVSDDGSPPSLGASTSSLHRWGP
jgi:hypothetical protein